MGKVKSSRATLRPMWNLGKQLLGRDPDRSWYHCHTSVKLFWLQPMDPWTSVASAWTRIWTEVSSSMRWCSNQLSHPDDPLGQASSLIRSPLPSGTAPVPSIRDGGEYLCWHCFNQLVRAPARRAGNPDSNPGPVENFSVTLTTQDLSDGYYEN